MALLFRGYFATAYSGNFMRREDGTPTNGVHQFLIYFLDGIKTFDPSHIFCCWDMGSKTFRTEMYPNYKANRSAPPEELIPQFELVKDVVTLLTFRILAKKIMKLMMELGHLQKNTVMIMKLGFKQEIRICCNLFNRM